MRSVGYSPDRTRGQEEQSFSRSLAGRKYPRFHIYVADGEGSWTFKLHLDQKKPSYEGTAAHSGEYEGPLVLQEAERIESLLKKS